jgi:hypothetical protein
LKLKLLFIYKKKSHSTYPKPVPLLPGLVMTFLPEAFFSFPALETGLKAETGPLKVP